MEVVRPALPLLVAALVVLLLVAALLVPLLAAQGSATRKKLLVIGEEKGYRRPDMQAMLTGAIKWSLGL
ncbi:MAG: hypothetical protein ABI968_15480, partial [Acidobacteriota bacterium]